MCGIVGVFEYSTGAPVPSEHLDAMTAMIRHRGPDGTGAYRGRASGSACGACRSSTWPAADSR